MQHPGIKGRPLPRGVLGIDGVKMCEKRGVGAVPPAAGGVSYAVYLAGDICGGGCGDGDAGGTRLDAAGRRAVLAVADSFAAQEREARLSPPSQIGRSATPEGIA